MAGAMKRLFLALLVAVSSAHAESSDPTRPPAAWLTSADGAAPGAEGSSGGLRLQSVLLRHGGRPVAIIGGKTVALGEPVGGAKLVRLTEREAVLQGADGVTHLFLTPDVEKQMIVTPKSRKTGKAGPVKDLP